MAQEAFDLAEQFQTPVFVMLDLDLGMNNWMSDGFKYPDGPINRGKLLTDEKLKELGRRGAATRTWTATALPYRTIPGDGMPVASRAAPATTPKASTASGPTTTSRTWIACRGSSRRRAQVRAEAGGRGAWPSAKIGFIGYGTSHWAIGESRDQLREETDVKTSYFRLRALSVQRGARRRSSTRTSASTSSSRTATRSCLQLMKLELTPERQTKLRSVLHYNGLPIDARSITDDVLAQERVRGREEDLAHQRRHRRRRID